MKKILSIVLTLVLAFTMALTPVSESYAYTVSSNMQWWSDDKFGMFIHLGSYSYYGKGEWVMHEQKISKKKYQTDISANFNPVNFDAQEIVDYAKAAGMKYIVITAKHHEGLSMWDTQVSSFKDYTGTKMYSLQQYTAFGSTGRDILMELKNACDAAGIKFGLYYSIIDWNHSSQSYSDSFTKMSSMTARTDYINDMKAQLQELVTRYNPAVMWFDGDWTKNSGDATLESWWTKSDGKALYNYMKEISPDIIVNERVCRGFNLGDFDCPEQTVPSAALSRSWETCQTMNDAWGYKKANEKDYRSTKSIVRELVTVASREGNYLLNIGPKGDGSMTAGSKKILKGMSSWMSTYSDSIYGTTRSPFSKDPSWGRYTRKDTTVYAHVFKWPTNKKLVTGKLSSKYTLSNVYLLNDPDTSLKYSVKNGKVTVKVPKNAPNKTDSVIVMQYTK